jgi:hypothetical protein
MVGASEGLDFNTPPLKMKMPLVFDTVDHDCQGCGVGVGMWDPPSFAHLQVIRQQLTLYLQSSRMIHSSKQCRAYYMLFEVPRYSFCPVSESHDQTSPSKMTHDVGFIDTKTLNMQCKEMTCLNKETPRSMLVPLE